jgi:hypothetical protein
MAIDNKYGRIEFPDADWVTIEPDEPVFILRGRDVIAPEVIKEYRKRAVEAGSPEHHLRMVDESLRKFKQWQQKVSVVPTSNDWLKAQTQYVAPSATTSIKDQESTESAEGVESSEDEESAQDLLAIFENGEKGTTGK